MDVPDKLSNGFLMWEPISISPFWHVRHLPDDETVVSAPLHLAIRQFPPSTISQTPYCFIVVKQFYSHRQFGG